MSAEAPMTDVQEITKHFSPDARIKFAADALRMLPNSDRRGAVSALVGSLPADDQREIASAALAASAPKVQKEVVQGLINPVGGGASPQIRDWLWLIIISGFAIVLVGSFLTLAISVFVASPERSTSAQMILTVFTAVVGFLAGLFAPSPVNQQSGDRT